MGQACEGDGCLTVAIKKRRKRHEQRVKVWYRGEGRGAEILRVSLLPDGIDITRNVLRDRGVNEGELAQIRRAIARGDH